MKKIAVLLAVVMLVSMLGGCYKSDLVFDFDTMGGVEVTSTVLGSKEMFEMAQVSSPEQLIETFAPETIEMYSAVYGMTETGERIEMVSIAADGTELPAGTALPTDGSMVGTRLRMKYENIEDALNSFTLMNHARGIPFVQPDGEQGLKVESKQTLYGTKYITSGKISIFGDETYKASYDAVEDAMKEKIKEASNTVAFKFPLCFGKNGDKLFLGTTLSYTATHDVPEQDVYFEVTVINPLILGMGIAILILLVVILVLVLKKKKDAPDAFFVDADGNEIPVFDVEDAEEESEEVVFDVEAIEETAEIEESEGVEETEENNE